MIALVIGGTGATGQNLVNCLVNDEDCTEIKLFVRKTVSYNSRKIKVFVVDFDDIASFSDEIEGDVFFSCLGTTLKQAGSKENQWEVDFNIPYDFARIAVENGVERCVLVSAYGASSESTFFYTRLKGLLEEAINDLNFKYFTIFRPGVLIRKKSDRLFEKWSVFILQLLNKMNLFKRYKPLDTEVLAEKLVKASKNKNKYKVVELFEIIQY